MVCDLLERRFSHPGWCVTDAGAIRGTPFRGSALLAAHDAIREASEALAAGTFIDCVSNWNGFFALVVQADGHVGLAVDRARSIPLFYSPGIPSMAVSDSAEWLRGRLDYPALDPARVGEFLLAGYVLNNATLCPGVLQVQSGEAIDCRYDQVSEKWVTETERYRVFKPAGTGTESFEESIREYDRVLTRCFERSLSVAGDRQIVVPLSGGYDSRLLLLMLVRTGAKNLVAYTYGRDTGETERSRYVAEAVGVPWRLCDYSQGAWRAAACKNEFWEYLRQASNLSTVACIQEWLAVRQLSEAGFIHPDAVLMPGYAADLPAGSFLSSLSPEGRAKLVSRDALEDLLWRDRLALWPAARFSDAVRDEIARSVLRSVDAVEPVHVWTSAYDAWMFTEQVPKWTVNAVRAADLSGFDWWLPFFDDEFLAFWERIPDRYRLGEQLHCDFTDKLFRDVTGSNPPARPPTAKYTRKEKEKAFSSFRKRVIGVVRAVYRSRALTPYRKRRTRIRSKAAYKEDLGGRFSVFSEEDYIDMSQRGASGMIGMLAEKYLEMLTLP